MRTLRIFVFQAPKTTTSSCTHSLYSPCLPLRPLLLPLHITLALSQAIHRDTKYFTYLTWSRTCDPRPFHQPQIALGATGPYGSSGRSRGRLGGLTLPPRTTQENCDEQIIGVANNAAVTFSLFSRSTPPPQPKFLDPPLGRHNLMHVHLVIVPPPTDYVKK